MKRFSIDELVAVAKRDNNTKRPYLYVNLIQGKHIPVVPSKALELYKHMGDMLFDEYPKEKILVIGFAETATAVGAAISCYASNVFWCMQTTREKYDNAKYLYFTESHSHATEQSVIINELDEVIGKVDRIVFAEDEVTTGNTIVKLITSIKEYFANIDVKYSILSILNSMTVDRIKELKEQDIDCLYVDKIPYEYKIDTLGQYEYSLKPDCSELYNNNYGIIQSCCNNLRFVQNKEDYQYSITQYVEDVIVKCNIADEKSVLVLGTEEFMYPPLMVARSLEKRFPDKNIRFHATTRSPILASKTSGYPLYNRNRICSMYDYNRTTYVYNLATYDLVIVLTDSSTTESIGMESLSGVLSEYGCKNIIIGKE